MGSKISKSRGPSNDSSYPRQEIPYCFLDTSKLHSSDVPNMIKMIVTPRNEPFDYGVGSSDSLSSMAFDKDENYLLYSIMYLGSVNSVTSMRWIGERPHRTTVPPIQDNLCLVNLHTGELHRFFDISIRDMSVSSQHVAFLTYFGYCKLHVAKLRQFKSQMSQLRFDTFEEKGSIESHSTCCSFSPDGKWLVVAVCSNLFTVADKNHLDLYRIDNDKLRRKQQTCVTFMSVPQIIVSLDFSPDSEFLAAGNFAERTARVYLLSTKTWQVILDIEGDSMQFGTIWGTFNPLCTHHQLISSTELGWVKKWDISYLYDEQNGSVLKLCNSLNISEGDHVVFESICITTSPRFSPDGNMFAITQSDGNVTILDPNLFVILWMISCPDIQFELGQAEHLDMPKIVSATSVCFSKSCKYLAIGHSRRAISTWLLPRMHFTLKHLCRTKIINMCPPKLIRDLPIPDSLKQYLLYKS